MNQVETRSTDASLPSYCLRFGWSADPFSSDSDKAPYYIPSSWDQFLDVIQHVHQHENALISIIGPHGSGKSTLLKQTLLQIDSNTLTYVLLGNHQFTPDSLLSSLSSGFGIPMPTGDSLEEKYDNLLTDLQLNSQSCLLIFDNAHLLSLEVIQHICYCVEQQTDYQMRLHFILVGDASLKQLLDTAGFNRTKQIKIHNLLLQKFTELETTQYLHHRIITIDQHGQMPFQNETIKYIQLKSSGYPEHINQTASYVLQNKIKLKPTSEHQVNKTTSFSYQHWILGGLLTIIIISIVSLFLKPVAKPLPTVKTVIHKQVLIHTTLTPATSASHNNVTKLLPEFHPLKPMSSNSSNINYNNPLNPVKSIDGKTYTKLNKVQLNSISDIGLLNSNKLTNKKLNNNKTTNILD